MTLTLEISPEAEQVIVETARQRGLTPEQQAQEALNLLFLPQSHPVADTPEVYETAADSFADLIGLFSYESDGYNDKAFAEGMAQRHTEGHL